MEYISVFKRTLLEFIDEVDGILDSQRYEFPKHVQTELKAAKITIAAGTPEVITEVLQTFGKFMLQFETEIKKADTRVFKRLQVCKACPDGDLETVLQTHSRLQDCVCERKCTKKCVCDAKCTNCSELLKNFDSKTFNAVQYIIAQALEGGDDEKEDIAIIFQYISSLLAAAKGYKKR